MKHFLMAICAIGCLNGSAAFAQDPGADGFVCAKVPEPVISLNHGSRYSAGDSSRSDFDQTSNDDVNAQLKPVDDFISDLANAANRALSTPTDQQVASACVLSGLVVWAKADGLSKLETMNAQLSAPSRLAGFAFAYAQVKPFLHEADDQAQVERWLSDRAEATITYFDSDAPKNASKNNLRAWAALAVGRVGITLERTDMMAWAESSVRLVICQAAPDGSLPLEMARNDLALHYQLHAVAPVVVTAALLQGQGYDLFVACDRAIHRAVEFVLAAFENPAMVEQKTGYAQSYFDGSENLRGFELAWAEAYLNAFNSPAVADFVAEYRPLGNSKLGGRQSLVWSPSGHQIRKSP